MKLVYTAESLIDGKLVVDLLGQVGIPGLLFNQNAVGGFGDLPVTYPEVWVERDADAKKALRAIARFENSPAPALDKTCGVCAERNPTTFEICWQCNAEI